MTKSFYRIIIFFFIKFNLFSQNITILDSVSKEPIPYVHVFSKKKHFLTDSLGVLEIELSKDTFKTNVLGYIDKSFILNFKKNDTIFLVSNTTELKEVVIKFKSKQKTKKIKPNKYSSFITKDAVALIKINNNDSIKIKNIGAYIKKKPTGNYIRPHIYKLEGNKLIPILDNSILKFSYKNKKIIFDVENMNIFSKDDIYIGFEFFNLTNLGRIQDRNIESYFYNIPQDKLVKLETYGICFGFFIELVE